MKVELGLHLRSTTEHDVTSNGIQFPTEYGTGTPRGV